MLAIETLARVGIYVQRFKVNNRNTRKSYETCSELPMKTPERRH